MISISKFTQLCNDIKTAVPEIKEVVIAVHEGQATAKLGSKPGIILLGVIPSADRAGQRGQAIDVNSMLFFFLQKAVSGDINELEQFGTLQQIALKARAYIEDKCDDGEPLFNNYNPTGTTIDPENFAGFNGWSMSVEF